MILIIHSSEKKMWMQDTSLSLQAKGLMLVLTTQFTSGTSDRETIMSHFTNGDSSFRATLEQLRIRDYVRLNTVRSDAGRYTTVVWEVFDEPTSERTKFDITISINGMQYPVRKSAAS